MRYFIYARKSTDEANRQVRSIEAQLHELKELASKENLEVIEVLTESQTAKEPGRPVFNAMLDRIERGEAQGILAWHPDRLARNSVDGGRVIYLLDTGKLLGLRFSIFWFEPSPQGKFMLNIAFGQSKYYVDNLSENVKRGLRAKVRRGLWPSYAPFGYLNNRQDGTIYPDPEKAPFVRKMFDLYATGRTSLKELADILYGLGLGNKRRGTKLSPANLQHILQNPIYYGLVRWLGEDHEGTHEPLIAKPLFDVVQRVMKQRKSTKKRRPLREFVFRGLFFCGQCGAMFTTERQKGHNYYRCTRYKGFCTQPYIREELLMEQVRAECKKLVLPEDWADQMIAEINGKQEEAAQSSARSAQAIKEQIAGIDRTVDKLVDAYLAGDIDKDAYQRKRSDLTGQKMDLKGKLEEIGRNGTDSLEPAIKLINWSKELNKHVFEGNSRALAKALQISSSNRQILAKKVTLTVGPPFSLLLHSGDHLKWRP
jgi:site-specific DNA recombinase